CDKQTEQAWSASQKAPSVTVTWGWGSHDFLADLGNNAHYKSIRQAVKYCSVYCWWGLST
ncbi:hypothetical protein ACB035_15715, partial [Aeromonas sp. S12(2024)]|uniref:hypothetical protein n=1 Tax=Aeromonas sp. S12(2024) TaxID=3242885 RepID=UPI003529B048